MLRTLGYSHIFILCTLSDCDASNIISNWLNDTKEFYKRQELREMPEGYRVKKYTGHLGRAEKSRGGDEE